MSTRIIVILLASGSFVAGLWLVAAQRHELTALRAAQTAADQGGNPGENHMANVVPAPIATVVTPPQPSSELLQLRNQVTLLSAEVKALSSVTQENARLHSQLDSAAPNTVAGLTLPPGYLRKNQARPSGYNTPEDTLQSFFFGLSQHDTNHIVAALTPSAAQRFQSFQLHEYFKQADLVPGYAVRGRLELPDGTVELQVEVAPGFPTARFRFQQVNGQWKLETPM